MRIRIATFKTIKNSNPFLFLFFLISAPAFCQINESATQNQVYEYLSRMAQKGLAKFNDYLLPLNRQEILNALNEVKAADTALSKVEAKELNYYLKEFAFDSTETSTKAVSVFRTDDAGRYRTLLINTDDYKIFLDPLLGASYFNSQGKHTVTYWSGVRLAGYFGKHFGFNFSFRDVTERGDTINRTKTFTPDQGVVITGETSNTINYSNLNFNIGYNWNKGSLSFGKDNLTWGYGIGGKIVLSDKAPSFPYLQLNFKPWPWLHFNYFHGWLASDIIDSAKTYPTGTGIGDAKRIIYRSKFIADHSVTITPLKGLDISLGESMVYSDRLDIGYLIPINFFKAYDHYKSNYNIAAGDNAQFFAQISSRDHLRKAHLYAELLIDEIKISKIFNPTERRNQIGYTVGLSRTDFLFSYLTIGAEYSRINPFVYSNLIPAQNYASHSYSLGDWMGNNADRLYLYIHFTPVDRLKIKAWNQSIRKGAPGTLYQQYFVQPQPGFLFQQLFSYTETGASIAYEWLNRMNIWANAKTSRWKYPATSLNAQSFNIGLSYGF